ncbi:MAG: 50S ribosomal protein L19 [Planctomycetota bacterium]|nr:50S ribosomal protein L19 [Planctomycetota bacterium]MCX8039792.1 50S ribosomal protein L19 [Planctomycetota bacterium]MDW8373171.1 50S ribosomal protein L19 [Planctomycetota bacterium]
MHPLLDTVTRASRRKEPLGEFRVGDTVDVHCRIKEGDKERIQIFTGTVIAKKRGHGAINASFTVRRIVAGEGVERTWPIDCPRIAKVEVVRHGRVRRAKLYYLRGRVGKATKVKELLEHNPAEKAEAVEKAADKKG